MAPKHQHFVIPTPSLCSQSEQHENNVLIVEYSDDNNTGTIEKSSTRPTITAQRLSYLMLLQLLPLSSIRSSGTRSTRLGDKKHKKVTIYPFFLLVISVSLFLTSTELRDYNRRTYMDATTATTTAITEELDRPTITTLTTAATNKTTTNTKGSDFENNNHNDSNRIQNGHMSDQHSKGPLLQTLHDAGIRDYSELVMLAKELPKWDDVLERFGKEPVIVGLDRCEAFQRDVPARKRLVGVAGTFNCGTNFLFNLLRKNCRMPNDRKDAIRWQVNWGKHQSPKYRFNITVYPNETSEYFLPVVTVRDPYSWMQSMCQNPYSARWYHATGYHCPNLVPNDVERFFFNRSKTWLKNYSQKQITIQGLVLKAGYTLDMDHVPVKIAYKSYTAHHESLVHMWKDWYQDYYDATFPRLMVRMEDLVYHPRPVLKQVCECAGGYLNKDLKIPIISAKHGRGDGKRGTGLVDAMINHGRGDRTMNMTHEDLQYSVSALKGSPIMGVFGYAAPH